MMMMIDDCILFFFSVVCGVVGKQLLPAPLPSLRALDDKRTSLVAANAALLRLPGWGMEGVHSNDARSEAKILIPFCQLETKRLLPAPAARGRPASLGKDAGQQEARRIHERHPTSLYYGRCKLVLE